MDNNSLTIVLPHRIGDCILTIPAVKCLIELDKLFGGGNLKITLVTGSLMHNFIKALNIAPVQKLDLLFKLKSQFCPINKLFCFLISSKLIGLRTKESYGAETAKKNYLKFNHNIPALLANDLKFFPDKKLADYMKHQYKFSNVIINNFSLCLSSGFSSEQIKTALAEVMNEKYMVICMEAGYGKKKNEIRRRSEDDFFETAEYLYQKYRIKSFFIGTDTRKPIPDKSYFIDCRNPSSSIEMLAVLISLSCGYIGSDTGPLHLASLLKKNTLGIYNDSLADRYGPVHAGLNFPLHHPDSADDIKRRLDVMINSELE